MSHTVPLTLAPPAPRGRVHTAAFQPATTAVDAARKTSARARAAQVLRDNDGLVDLYGRVARDLRVSLTDRCNLRCTYCMPAEGMRWRPLRSLLTAAEIIRLISIGVTRLGIRCVRFTGGEPLIRPELVDIVAATARLRTDTGQRPDIALTTNGIGLARVARPLRDAGLSRVNISLDSLEREEYQRITRRDRLPSVLAGIDAALESGLSPVKLNTLLSPGVNEDQIIPLVRYALDRGLFLRFIEHMPLGARPGWHRNTIVTATDIIDRIADDFIVADAGRNHRSDPARRWVVTDPAAPHRRATIGIIASVTQPFCSDCDRTRLTADGSIRSCLFSDAETSLRDLLRQGASDTEIIAAWRGAMVMKPAGHGIDDPGFIAPARGMSEIGG